MDNSLEYIVYCANAKKIQSKVFPKMGEVNFKVGQWFVEVVSESWYFDCYDGEATYEVDTEGSLNEISIDGSKRKGLTIVYLPTFDEITKYIMEQFNWNHKTFIFKYAEWLKEDKGRYESKFETMEQTVLAYYMHLNDGIWDDTKGKWLSMAALLLGENNEI